MKSHLATLWIYVMFNMAFADIVGFLNPGAPEEMMAMKPSPEMLVVFAVLPEIPIVMIVPSRLLPHKANHRANIVASVIAILIVVGAGTTAASHIFFASIEVVAMLAVIWRAWKWTDPQA